jgi:SAM-dependent methyltransferase
MKIGVPLPILTEDRRILEQIILPYFAKDPNICRILFVGTAKYTWHYRKLFAEKEYWTIEPRLLNAPYGAKRHIIGYLDHIDRYFERNSLDLIICNGVLGYGLNEPEEIDSSFKKCYLCLREGGVLVIGWNNRKEFSFLPLEKIKSLQRFQPLIFPPLSKQTYPMFTENPHVFSFYYKPNSQSKLLSNRQ